MSNADRRRLIARAVRGPGSGSVPELGRGLDFLATQGVLERFRGGARTLLPRGGEPPRALRVLEAVDAERRIVAESSRLIADGETVPHDSLRPRR